MSAELRRRGERTAPASAGQERLWLIEETSGGSATYNVPVFLAWRERIDVAALASALEFVVERHEALRTAYELRDGRLLQTVLDPRTPPIEVIDADSAEAVRAEAERRGREPFDLAKGTVLRCVVWRGSPGCDALLLVVHHIAVDGWSLQPLLDDLAVAYDAALEGKRPPADELPLQYADFAVWDRAMAQAPEIRRAVEERADHLVEFSRALVLDGCTRNPAADEGSRPGRQRDFPIPPEVSARVGHLSLSLRATPFVLWFAAVQAALYRWSGRREFLVGAVTANRNHPELEPLIGFFVNTVPLRCAVDPDWSFAELCRKARTEAYRSLSHQKLPFDQLTTAVNARRGTGRSSLVDVGFVHQAPPTGHTRWAPPVELPTETAKFDLMVIVNEVGDDLTVTVEYDTDRYSDEACGRLGETLVALLTAAVGDPDRPLTEFLGEPPAVQGREATSTPAPRKRESAPLTREQRRAAELFVAVLSDGGRRVGVGAADELTADADFFVLGGHSLLAVSMLAEAERRYGVELSPRVFLTDPTVAGLAEALTSAEARRDAPMPAVDDGPLPATSAQQRFWLLDRMPWLRPAYLSPTVVELAGDTDREALRRAVDTVLARHPALRSRFSLDRKERRVHYRTDGPPAVTTVTAAPADPRAHLAEICTTPFDLAKEAPVRADIMCLDGRTVLALVPHHIVVDGWSAQVLLDQIAAAYRRDGDLAEPVHPAAVAEPVDADRVGAVVERLRGAPLDPSLPHDRPRGELQSTSAATVSVFLGEERLRRLREVAVGELGCSTFVIAAALMGAALARGGGGRDFLLAFPWSGRDSTGAADAVGMFVNTLVVRVDLTGEPTWRELLARVRDDAKAAYRDATAPYDAVVETLHPTRDLGRPPLTPLYVTSAKEPDLSVPFARHLAPDPLFIKYELELTALERGDDLELELAYATALFDERTAHGLLDAMVAAAADLSDDPDSQP
ncbi:condensation domain-containing protein [Streptomyces sp. NPDC048664]|uniref:condensation domain-containing protein n=1 Tax=Streptomyces sp. NPDC048664 TaxID=3154505 RepID=UPI00342F1B8E